MPDTDPATVVLPDNAVPVLPPTLLGELDSPAEELPAAPAIEASNRPAFFGEMRADVPASHVLHRSADAERLDRVDWNTVREQFTLSRDYLHFAQFFMVSHPKPVREAIARYRDAIDDNPFLTVEHNMFGAEADNLTMRAREAAAVYMSGSRTASAREVALIPNSTTGLALVYSGLPLGPGDEVVSTEHEHFSHHEAIRLATQRVGATHRKVALHDSIDALRAVTVATLVETLRAAIGPATRVLGVTWVYSGAGLCLPVRAVADMLAEVNAQRPVEQRVLLVVDGTHGFGARAEAVADLGCDVFVSSVHKWICGPRGTGIIWAPEDVWARMQPTAATYYSFDLFEAWTRRETPNIPTRADLVSPGGFLAYEHQWAMADAFDFQLRLGRERVAERVRRLNQWIQYGLEAIDGVRLHTPLDPHLSAGIICFDIPGMTSYEVIEALHERKVMASNSPYGDPCPRLSAGIMNTPEEIDLALDLVAGLAAQQASRQADG